MSKELRLIVEEYLDLPAGSSRMQRGPTFVVLSINIGSMLHQELNHVEIIIDAGLQRGKDNGLENHMMHSRYLNLFSMQSKNYATKY